MDEGMPQLTLLERRHSSTTAKPQPNIGTEETYKSKVEELKKNGSEVMSPSKRKNSLLPSNIVQPTLKEENLIAKSVIKFNNETSKNLITEMLKKISLKSMSEENYPISNQTVQRLMVELEIEIKDLNAQKSKFQNSLLLNPSNSHLKKQLQAVEKNINQVQTIKDLYREKIDFRNKISDLQSKIMQLKQENRELKIKIERGIQKIETHIHNLPCEKEKQLIEEVNKCKEALNREREMRLTLEHNIQSINLNFKRFYEEADNSRKIVSEQLKDINKREQQLNTRSDKLSLRPSINREDSHSYKRQNTNRLTEQENVADIINQINSDHNLKQSFPNQLIRTTYKDQPLRLRSYTNALEQTKTHLKIPHENSEPQRLGQKPSTSKQQSLGPPPRNFLLQEQIQKMRMNQTVFNKMMKKKV